MLTTDLLKQNQALAGLTEDQLKAISVLSENDEKDTIGKRIGELHGMYDNDVLSTTGVQKNQGEKTYDYVKRVLSDLKTKASGSVELQNEIASLKKQIQDGNADPMLKKQLADAQSELQAIKGQYESKVNEYEQRFVTIEIDKHFDKAFSGLKFKSGYPETIQRTLIDAVKREITGSNKIDFVEDQGNKVLVFRDDKGNILRNSAKGLNPYTVSDLVSEKLKDVLDFGRKVEGSGSQGSQSANQSNALDLSTAKSQVEADKLITNYLMQSGEVRGTASFAAKQKEIRDQNKVALLPLK